VVAAVTPEKAKVVRDPRNPNWDSKIVYRPDGSRLEMYRHHGQESERPHHSQEYDSKGNTDIRTDVHRR
jgi:hypothetical protein